MKKISLSVLLLFFSGLLVFAQTEKKNIVKVFPTSFVFGKGTFGYERVIDEKSSFTFNLGIPTGVNPLNVVSVEENDEMNLLSGKLNAWVLMPGYRFNYSEKGAPLGFFMEPYLKYERYNAIMDSEFIDDEKERFLSNIDANYGGFGAGIQIGIQYLIKDVVSVEWSIIGLEAKVANLNFVYTDLDGGVDIDDVNEELQADYNDLPIIGKRIEYETASGKVYGKAKGFIFPGVRSAFSIGIAF